MRERGADRRGGVGRGGRRRRRAGRAARTRSRAGAARRRARDGARCSAAGAGTTPRSSCASDARPGQTDRRARRSSPRRNATTVVEPGWQARVTALDHLVLERRAAARGAHARSAPTVDPVMLEVFNNLFMNIAEQMGAAAAEHRLLGQHQGAARLLLRAVRRRRQPDRQRAAHAGAPGLDGRVDQDRDRAQRRARCSRATSTC